MATAARKKQSRGRSNGERAPDRARDHTGEAEAKSRRRRGFWSGTITFGLVAVPVDLMPANRSAHVALRMLAPDGTPVVRRYYCPKQERSVDWDDIVHGYEVDSGRYVVLSEAELQALAPKKSREIDLSRFVSRRSIDPILFERAYFLAPAGSSSKAYHLLVEAMEATDQAGIGTFVMRGKEHLAAILAESGVLRLEMLRFADEVRSPASLGLGAPRKPDAQRLRSMIQAIDRLATAKLGRQELEERYSDRVRALAAKKLERGVDVVELPEAARRELNKDEQGQNIVDLMESLKRSLGVAPKRVGPMRSASVARTTQPTSAKSARRRPATTRRPHAPRAA